MSFFQALLTGIGRPAQQATNIVMSAVSTTTMTLSWTNGSGQKRIMVLKAANEISTDPSDNTTYTANTAFGSGTQIGTGNYVVFNGTGSTVSITALTANTKYAIRVYEYSGVAGHEKYNVLRATDNPINEYTFTTEYAAVLTRAGVQGFTTPVFADQVLDNQLMRRNLFHNVMASVDAFWYIANSVQNFTRINWKTPASNELALVSSPTFTADQGINGNGSSSYVNTNFVPSTATLFAQNDCSFVAFITNEGQDAGFDVGAIDPGPDRISLIARNGSDILTINVNDNTNHTVANAIALGIHQIIRTSSTTNISYRNLKVIFPSTGGATTTARPAITVYLGARHNTTVTDVADGFSAHRYGALAFGNQFIPQNHAYANIIARYQKFKPVFPTVPKTGITIIEAFGDSFTVGQAASPSSNAYLNQFITNNFPAITPTNYAVSGKGAWVTVDAACQISANGTTALWMEMTGQNDLYRNCAVTQTLNKIEAMMRVMFVNHYGASFSPAGSATNTVRTGAYIDQYNARTTGGRFSSNPIPGTTAVSNDPATNGGVGTITYTFTGTRVAVQLISDSGVADFGTCTLSIDGVVRETVDLNVWYDNASDGVNGNQQGPVAFWFTGLTNSTHTITVTSNGDGLCPVDFFTTLIDPLTAAPIIFTEIPYRNDYSGGGCVTLSQTDFDLATARKLSMAQTLRGLGYPIAFYHINKYYDRTSIDPDNVHPDNGGHRQIASGYLHLFDGT